jgi:inhibitor of KinA sporulation pathway (predicted exonuclease)
LTGLTQDEVDGGLPFGDACRLLAAEHASGARPWASWGDYDRHQFTRQCGASRTPYPFGRRHTNAKAVFTEVHGLRKRPGMAQALDIAGLPLEGRHHRGEDDAWNIAALVLHLADRDGWPSE